jgi:hypothetical protein
MLEPAVEWLGSVCHQAISPILGTRFAVSWKGVFEGR